MTVHQALSWGRQELRRLCDAEFSARFLLSDILELDLTGLTAHLDDVLDGQQRSRYEAFIGQRILGTPLGYIVGSQYFDGLRFKVTKDVLIPRPETELLVEESFKYIDSADSPVTIIDVGTGSGAVAIALATRLKKIDKQFTLYATDQSAAALEVATQNAKDLPEISFIKTNLLEDLPAADIIIANLPYIPTERLKNLEVTKYEPISALDGGEDGLDYYRELLEQIKKMPTLPEALFFEIDETQGPAIRELLKTAGYSAIIRKDLNGLDRIVIADYK